MTWSNSDQPYSDKHTLVRSIDLQDQSGLIQTNHILTESTCLVETLSGHSTGQTLGSRQPWPSQADTRPSWPHRRPGPPSQPPLPSAGQAVTSGIQENVIQTIMLRCMMVFGVLLQILRFYKTDRLKSPTMIKFIFLIHSIIFEKIITL